MKLIENIRVDLWNTGESIIERVPTLATEIRKVISLVQNPVEVSEEVIQNTFVDFLRIFRDFSDQLSPVVTQDLGSFFNYMAAAFERDFALSFFGSKIVGATVSGAEVSFDTLYDMLAGVHETKDEVKSNKKYLVAISAGKPGLPKSYIVEMPNDYTPASDDMAMLKVELIKQCKLGCFVETINVTTKHIDWTEYRGQYKPEELEILAVSNLNV